MGKNKTLLIIISVLLVSNLVLLYLLVRPQPVAVELSRTEKMVKMLQEELQLDSAQTTLYLQLRARRDSLLKPLQTDLRNAKLNLINLLHLDSLSDAQIDTATTIIGRGQMAVEEAYFRHFMRMRLMLRQEQKPKLDSMLIRMVLRGPGGNADTTQTKAPNGE